MMALIALISSFLMYFLNKPSNTDVMKPMTTAGLLGRSKATPKRKPKAMTDLMAYNLEIQEQGENRG